MNTVGSTLFIAIEYLGLNSNRLQLYLIAVQRQQRIQCLYRQICAACRRRVKIQFLFYCRRLLLYIIWLVKNICIKQQIRGKRKTAKKTQMNEKKKGRTQNNWIQISPQGASCEAFQTLTSFTRIEKYIFSSENSVSTLRIQRKYNKPHFCCNIIVSVNKSQRATIF